MKPLLTESGVFVALNADKTKKRKIHTRKIDIAIYQGSKEGIIVEGILKDDRLLDSYRLTGGRVPSGTIHHMIIRIEVKGPGLIIEDIEVEMPTVPHKICQETLECLTPIKGMPIVSGFTSKVKALAGGPKGCNHLLTLLTAMAPAAVQGAFSAMTSKPIDPGPKVQGTLERFKNTCWAWRENGPLMEMHADLAVD
ncbi:MAG: DUF2889 domain-containing protein [Desulfobacteraceae bacterium]